MGLSQRGHPVSSDSAGAAGRFKRQRVREAEARRQEQRVEDVLTHTTHIVDAIATINGKYVLTLNDERARLVHQVTELQTQLTKHQRQHAEDTTHLVLSEFARLRGVVSSGVKDRLLQSLREEANKGHADVFDAVSAHVDDALQGSLAVADTELSAERQLNHTLVQQLQNYTQTLLREVKGATSRAFRAEVEVMQRDVLVAKLQAACVFAQTDRFAMSRRWMRSCGWWRNSLKRVAMPSRRGQMSPSEAPRTTTRAAPWTERDSGCRPGRDDACAF
ncbi:hypothetical_protein (plasmid) [Leishmania braziliensis MHOM/BR/75/M2904]|uniref:Hypothetical_protein n=1 Tax=Leishmania braziliensis MHOM/BR/75/M2904 TaxID=420245 RepID=A0A3P3Z867_LEIBR|nr:hypothetical_protein [Leishmania braziliensis MHOM/BR/75/M2904]